MADAWGEEEDNNPYGSFAPARQESISSTEEQPRSPGSQFKQIPSPSSGSPTLRQSSNATSSANNDDDVDAARNPPFRRKEGGYDSRVERILSENPDLNIMIPYAGKNTEGGGSYIAYTIRTGDLEVRRRYRDFASLRTTLVNLHPTLIVPPIPEKHSIADYAAKPTKAKEDEGVIEHRKRMLASFLNRCRRMQEVREDGVFWRFLDPNASWTEVLHSHPVSSLPKSNLKAPPLDPANPTPGHNYLPIPSNTAKLKSQREGKLEMSGTPVSPPPASSYPSAAAHTIPGPQIFGRFPPPSSQLSEQELDPYFVNFEASSRELETLLQGNMEKINRRTLSHLGSLAEDMSELGARLNGFSLSEQSATLAAAIEKLGQAVDSTYIATGDMSAALGANFSDPMRESAQFAGIVRSVLRFRILKRIQGEMTRDDLEKKRTLLNQLERSELEAQRIEEHLERSGFVQTPPPKRSNSAGSASSRPRRDDDNASVDSDFATSGDNAHPPPSASQGLPPRSEPSSPTLAHKKTASGNFVTNKIFGRINHAIYGIVDVDPERTRRDQIGKTRESLVHLEQAIDVSDQDVKDASIGVLRSLQQFQNEKEDDLRRYMVAYARVHIDWAKRNLASWEEAKGEVDKIDARRPRRVALFTTSSNKKPRYTYSSKGGSSQDKFQELFATNDETSSTTPDRSSPHPPSPPTSNSSPPTPRYIPPYLQQEVLGSSSSGRGKVRGMTSSEAENGLSNPGTSNTAPASLAESGIQKLAFGDRASSPAKRSASELEEGMVDTQKTAGLQNGSSRLSRSPEKSSPDLASPMPSRFKSVNGSSRDDPMSVDSAGDISGQTSNGGSEDFSYANGSSTPPTSTSARSVERSPTKCLPSYDEQWSAIQEKMEDAELNKEGAKGFLVSTKWLSRLKSRTTEGSRESTDKTAREGEVGPVDNSDIAFNDHFYGDLRDEAGEVFVPLREGASLNADFEILPESAWNLVSEWYSVAEPSYVLLRTMHSTAGEDAPGENLQYELFPPVCTIQKLRNDRGGLTHDAMKENEKLAPSLVASRADNFQSFLKRAKEVSGIVIGTKVRVWKLLETGETTGNPSNMPPTPDSSRAGSPVPHILLPKITPKLVVDLNAFTSLGEGTQRERLDFNDETANEKYNGHLTVDTVGFPPMVTLVLEEQDTSSSKEEFITDGVGKTAGSLGVDLMPNSETARSKSSNAAGRRSPTPSGIMTRGRTTKKGRTRGCTGLQNLGNTCYMNSALQCIRSVQELAIYFIDQKFKEEINAANPLGHGGAIAKSYSTFLEAIYSSESSGSFAPRTFKATLGRCQPLFSGYGQQDSQEFLSFLVDGLHEDLNRVIKKPYMENPESDDKTVHQPEAIKELGEQFRRNFRARNDSVAMDLFSGFYKNTMICPVCDKVSVTFDPYSLLTLQLPIEQTFQHIFAYAPLHGPMYKVKVDIDKNSSIRMLKEYFTKRVNVPADRLIIAEEYNQRFYQVLEDNKVISESNLAESDKFIVFELDEAPTNWPPPTEPKKPSFNAFSYTSHTDTLPDMSTAAGDRMAVPIAHRVQGSRGVSFGLNPSFILITRDEAKDADKILRKVLQKVDTMTTTDLFSDQSTDSNGTSEHEDRDAVVMSEEDSVTTDEGKVQARSVESEDGLVDVTMAEIVRSAADNSTTKSRILEPDYYIEPELRNLFDLSFYWNGSYVPASMGLPADTIRAPTLESRMRRLSSQQSSRRASNASGQRRRRSSASSEDELQRPEPASVLDTDPTTPLESEDEAVPPTILRNRRPGALKTISKSKRRQSNDIAIDDYILRLGEGLILDWSQDGYDQLFSGEGGPGQRGSRSDLDLQTLPDQELDAKRSRRAARKKTGITLDECFEETSKTEILSEDNAWYCGRCKELRRATKKLEIWTVPDILVIHLKRFSTNSRLRDKIDVLVDCPVEGLSLEGKVGLPESKTLQYDLFAVDNHYGGLGGGHYTAFAQNFFDKKWYEYNDQMVSSASPDGVVTKAAYLLFYRRRSEKPLGGPRLEEIVAMSNEPLLGEGMRPDDISSSGSSEGSLGAGHGTGAGVGAEANHQSAQNLGPGGFQHGQSRGNPLASRMDDHTLPSYSAHFDDEALGMDYDRDQPVQSMEENHRFIGPSMPNPSWNFDSIPNIEIESNDVHEAGGAGYNAPPGSDNGDNGSMTLNPGSDGPDAGDLRGRIMEDFGDDGVGSPWQNDDFEDDENRVQHVPIQPSEGADEEPVDVFLGSDDERSTELK